MKEDFEKLDLSCPRCGGVMEIKKEENQIYCPYCKHKILLKKKESIKELIEKERQMSYARKDGENLAIEESEKRKHKRKVLNKIIVTFSIIFSIAFLVLISFLVVWGTKKKMDDPFKYVSINFTGTNGHGKAEVVINDSYIKNDITYKLSRTSNLKNDDIIYVTAESDKYRFVIKKKNIKVKGLYNYLFSLDQLTDEIKEHIYSKSSELQKKRIENGYSFKGIIKSIEPYKIYLNTDGKTNSFLYVTHLVKISTKTGNIYERYLVTEYKNIIVINKKDDLIRYDSMDNIGSIIAAGTDYAGNKDYIGYITGFKSISDFEEYISGNNNTSYKITSK